MKDLLLFPAFDDNATIIAKMKAKIFNHRAYPRDIVVGRADEGKEVLRRMLAQRSDAAESVAAGVKDGIHAPPFWVQIRQSAQLQLKVVLELGLEVGSRIGVLGGGVGGRYGGG